MSLYQSIIAAPAVREISVVHVGKHIKVTAQTGQERNWIWLPYSHEAADQVFKDIEALGFVHAPRSYDEDRNHFAFASTVISFRQQVQP